MNKVVVALLALFIVGAVVFILVELRAPLAPASPAAPASPSPSSAAPSSRLPSQPRAQPIPAPPSLNPRAQPALPSAQPSAPSPTGDPLDVVVRGRTRREWHAYYAERQRQITADIQSYQAIVDRAIAGEEPDPRDLVNAHDQIRTLNQRLKADLEALQQIDATP